MKVSEFEAFITHYPECEGLFEYVHASDHMGEHYRFIPETRWTPTEAQLYARLEFTLGAYYSYGSKGFDELDDKILPVVAVAVAKRMKGKKYSKKKPLIESPSFWSKVKRRLRRKMFQQPEKLRIKKLKRIAHRAEEIRPKGEPSVLPMQLKPEEKKALTLTYTQVPYYLKPIIEMNRRIIHDVFEGREPTITKSEYNFLVPRRKRKK